MIYLRIYHKEDVDSDYFKFSTLEKAVMYLMENADDFSYTLQTEPFEEASLDAYTSVD